MKILVVHGEDTVASRQFVESTISTSSNKGLASVKISEDSSFVLSELLSSGNLFTQESLFILQNASTIPPKEIRWLSNNYKRLPGELLIYSGSTLSSGVLKNLSGIASIKEFRMPKILFSFLDSFIPGNAGVCLRSLHLILKREPPEFVFAVLGRHLRDLYWAAVSPQTLGYPSWRLSKLKYQSGKIGEAKLKRIIKSMARIDLAAKSSNQELVPLLDLLIASQLE